MLFFGNLGLKTSHEHFYVLIWWTVTKIFSLLITFTVVLEKFYPHYLDFWINSELVLNQRNKIKYVYL